MYEDNLDKIKENIIYLNETNFSDFRYRYFKNCMKTHSDIKDFLFLDIDLISSTKNCIKCLWKYFHYNACFFSDDEFNIDII